jgi:hypothetical protein
MSFPRIISFSGRKGSGKSLLTLYLKNKYNYKIINFADELKNLICNILNISFHDLESKKDQLNDQLQNFINNNLESICDLLHNEICVEKDIIKQILLSQKISSIRTLLQLIGTDLIRYYNPEWHINKIKQKLNHNEYYCFGDTRFINEKAFIESLNGTCWFIIRPDNLNISNHISEINLRWSDFKNNILINDTDKDTFELNFENALKYSNENVFIKYKDTFNIYRFHDIPHAYIYNLFLSYGVFEKENNQFYFTLKNCKNKDHFVFRKFLETNVFVYQKYNEFNVSECNEGDYVLKCKNPFIIENMKLYYNKN